MKTFSVVIPSYNSKGFIKDTIDSIVNTNYNKDFIEVIIIDDGSTDDTYSYVEELIKPFSYIKQIRKTNGNWGSVINYVRNNNLVRNEIISILDSDDRYLPETFNIVNQEINKNDVFVGSYFLFNGTKNIKKIKPYWFYFKKTLTNKQQMNTPYCLPLPCFMKKNIFYELKNLREGVAFQDPDYFSQITKNSKTLRFSSKPIGMYYFTRPNNSESFEWDYDKKFEPKLFACNKLIENGASECVSFQLNKKEFFSLVKTHNVKFKINSKLKFKWFPWYLRWIYFLIHFFKFRKFFILSKK